MHNNRFGSFLLNSVRLLTGTLIIATLILVTAFQKSEAQRLGVGVTGGVTISSHLNNFRYEVEDINLDFSPKFTSSFAGGFIVRRPITRGLRFQAEPSLVLLGAKYSDSFTLRGFEFESQSKTELLYIQLPLLLQLSTVPPERTVFGRQRSETTFHLTGGLFGGYLLDARFSGVNRGAPIGISFEGNFSEDVQPQYKEYDGGVVIGGGVEHGYNSKFGLEIRGFFSVIDSGNNPELSFKPQNFGISLALYYLL
jgi:hypothetical protein